MTADSQFPYSFATLLNHHSYRCLVYVCSHQQHFKRQECAMLECFSNYIKRNFYTTKHVETSGICYTFIAFFELYRDILRTHFLGPTVHFTMPNQLTLKMSVLEIVWQSNSHIVLVHSFLS